jgi:transcriptional regulator with XRE-family HTH domain
LDEMNLAVRIIWMMGQDHELIARQLVRALRGRRSQEHLSRRLGYRSNALYTWEAGQAFPQASRLFALAQCVGVDLDAGLSRFFRDVPPGLTASPLSAPEGIRRLCAELRGRTRLGALAEASGLSRFALSRWLSGKAQPSLPELLCYVDHASLRLLDFLAVLIDPAELPAVRQAWLELQAARELGYQRPSTQAVLHALETEAYRAAPSTATLATLTGCSAAETEQDLAHLLESGQLERQPQGYAPRAVQAIDFRRDPASAQRVKAYWAQLAAGRTEQARPGLFAYNVFAVSRADLARLTELQRAYLREMRTIIAQSKPSEVVALANFQLFSLGD